MKPKLTQIPTRKWASSEEVVKIAEGILDRAKKGELQGLSYVAERSDDSYESGSTRVTNCFAVAGYLLNMGMRMMGFVDTREQ